MRKFITFLSFVLSQFSFPWLWAYPEVKNWKQNPIVALENKKELKLEKKLPIKSPFAVVTGEKDQLALRLNVFDEVLVYPNSRIQVLDLADEQGFVESLYLLSGQIRYKSIHRSLEKGAKHAVIKSPFFDLPVINTVDLLIRLDMKTPEVEVKILEGSLPVEFFAYEKKTLLRAGESLTFKGILAADKLTLQYDYLLGGRKIPRGALEDVRLFDAAAFLDTEVKQEKSEQAEMARQKRIESEKRRKQKEYEDSFLCKKPFGQKDQCFWQSEGKKCFRYRCDVTGRWSDKTERPMPCESAGQVKSCDF